MRKTADAGAVDGMSAKQEYRVDGFTLEENSRTVQRLHDLLARLGHRRIAPSGGTAMPKITGSIVDAATGEPVRTRPARSL